MIVELIKNNDDDILLLADKATPDLFLCGHCVNLCILSLFLGKSFNYTSEQLFNLGLCAFLNDIWLSRTQTTVKKAQETEAAQFKWQSVHAFNVIHNMPGIAEDVKKLIIEVMTQSHNRNVLTDPETGDVLSEVVVQPHNRGSIESMIGSDINDFTRIITVADAYEKLTHPRPNRERMLPHDALKTLIGSVNQAFDSEIIKLFLERISLYPPGSYVKLNSEEIGKVVGLNKGLPTRPKVRILLDSSKQRAQDRKIIDLAASPMIFIKEAIDETKLNLSDKKLSLELKAVRWWVKGL